MARLLLCPVCNEARKALAGYYHELYESVAGKSKDEYLCDGSCHPTTEIHVGDLCFAAVSLPNKEHFNYVIQRPEAWMREYLETV